MLPGGSQVKCWKCEMKVKNVGDKVGKVDGEKSYFI